MKRFIIFCLFLISSTGFSAGVSTEIIRIAVASNALEAVKYLSREFTSQTGYKVSISSGSTGKLYAQIVNGAPFDIFLAANSREPSRLEHAGKTVNGTRSTYALGRLVLVSSSTELNSQLDIKQQLASIIDSGVPRFAIANPHTAPYGVAAKQVLENYELWGKFEPKLIQGENINQTFQFVKSGNVKYGLVALSQIKKYPFPGNRFVILPQTTHAKIEQQAVLLKRAKEKEAAKAFLKYLSSDDASRVLINKFGYSRQEQGG